MDEQLCTICFSLAGYREEELKLRGTDADPPDLYVRSISLFELNDSFRELANGIFYSTLANQCWACTLDKTNTELAL